jgi:hypothetical protein
MFQAGIEMMSIGEQYNIPKFISALDFLILDYFFGVGI